MSETNQKPNSKLPFVVGGLGATVTVAAQTKPEDAISNIGGWLKLIGVDQMPDFLATTQTDLWFTAGGLLLVLVAGANWFYRRRRARLSFPNIVYVDEDNQPIQEKPKETVWERIENQPPAPSPDTLLGKMRKQTHERELETIEDLEKPSRETLLEDVKDEFPYPYPKAVLQFAIKRAKGQKGMAAGADEPHEVKVMTSVVCKHSKPLIGCSAYVSHWIKDGKKEAINQFLSWGGKSKFDTHPHTAHNFYLVFRDISDQVTPEPFLMNFESGRKALADNSEYLLNLELRSAYPIPTIVSLLIKTGTGLDVECTIVKQELQPENSDGKAAEEAAQAETVDAAWDDITKDRVPFVRIRHIAHEFKLDFSESDSPTANMAWALEGHLRQAAYDEKLKVWGRKYNGNLEANEVLVPIPREHFADYEFRHGRLHYPTENKLTHTGDQAKPLDQMKGEVFFDLHLSYADLRREMAEFSEEYRNEQA
jgi:hypothetical protein